MGVESSSLPKRTLPERQTGDETVVAPRPGSSDGPADVTIPGVSPGALSTLLFEALPHGTVLAQRFVVQRQIGHGGMGDVYEAEDLALNHARVALKTIRADQTWQVNMRQRFRQEVLLARSITHPNVCPVYEFFSSVGPGGELFFLTMKLLSGETLADRLARGGPLSSGETLRFGRETAAALDCAHQSGVIHRDLKPTNIILEQHISGNRAVVTDFGLARPWTEEPWQTDGGNVVGTPAYIAPEVLDGHLASPQSDVYSFGIVLHEMLFGTRPDTASTTELRASKENARKRRLQSVIHRCIQAKPDDRYISAGVAMHALEKAWEQTEPVMTRRTMMLGGAAALALTTTAGEWLWRDGIDFENFFWPVPRPRRVAILPMSKPGLAIEDAALVNGVLESIGAQLSRAETSERDLFVIPPKVLEEQKVVGIAGALGTFGANLVLSASLVRDQNVSLAIQLLASATGKVIRSANVTCAVATLFDLPRLATEKAASLLDIQRTRLSRLERIGDTMNAEAYAAFERGRQWLRQYGLADTDQAIAELQKAVELDPQYARAWATLGEAYSHRYFLTKQPEALDLAERNCERAIKLAPDLALGYSRRAGVKRLRGHFEDAVADLKRALTLDANDVQAHLELAQILSDEGKDALSDDVYKRLLDDHPNHWLTINAWGNSYFSRANYARAAELFREATVAAPTASLPWRNLGAVYLALGKLPDATAALTRSIQLLPSGGAYTNLGTALFWQNKFPEAAEQYRRAALLQPRSALLWGNLGDALSMIRGRLPDAREAWRLAAEMEGEATRTNPQNAEATTRLALYRAKLGQKTEALNLVRLASSIRSPNADQLFENSMIYELAGNRDEALRTLGKCIEGGYSASEILRAPELAQLRRDARFKHLHWPA